MSHFRAQCFYGLQKKTYKVEQTKEVKWGKELTMDKITWRNEQTLVQIDDQEEKRSFGDKNFAETLAIVQKWRKKYNNSREIPIEQIPQHYDFRNINGYDFTSKVMD